MTMIIRLGLNFGNCLFQIRYKIKTDETPNSLMARRVLTLEVGEQSPSSSNIIQWNRFYSCKDYQQPFKQSPDNAPIIRYNLKTT